MKNEVKRDIALVILLLILPVGFVGYFANMLDLESNATQCATVEIKHRVAPPVVSSTLPVTQKFAPLSPKMEKAIMEAAEEFRVPASLIIGIANAESSLGTKFVHPYDYKCHNLWGLKGGNMVRRRDGSSLRCFIDERAGARTMAKTLRLYYLDEGRDTPEEIVNKYVGSKWSVYHDTWVGNVKKYFN